MVLTIGYYGGSIAGADISIETNQIGGYPIVPNELTDIAFVCEKCGGQLTLASQLFCPLDSSELGRNLFIFICSSSTCLSWNVFRLQFAQKIKPVSVAPNGKAKALETSSWCDDSDDWGDDIVAEVSSMEASVSKLESGLANIGIEQTDDTNKSHKVIGNGPKFSPAYINAAVCNDQSSDDSGSEVNGSANIVNNDNDGLGDESWQDEEYEKPSLSFDLCTYKFLKRVDEDPDQILRYDIGGSPIYFKPLDVKYAPSPCPNCNSARHFECQLMPNFLRYLKADPENAHFASSLDFTTVLIFSCPFSCGPNLVLTREACIVQIDTDCDNLNLLQNGITN